MDVSDRENQTSALTEPSGEALLQTVVSLTGLPEPLMHEELGKIVVESGHSTENLTLDELRSAMISYLESLQSEMEQEMLAQADDEADESEELEDADALSQRDELKF